MSKTVDLDVATLRAFVAVADLQNFTRAGEYLGLTQAAVSMKMHRLETTLGKRLVERSPRAVRLKSDGEAFLHHARAILAAHDAALVPDDRPRQLLRLGFSDHAAGPELVTLLDRLRAASPLLALSVRIDFSSTLLDGFDAGDFDAVIVRQTGSRRGGETLCMDDFGWFAAPKLRWTPPDPLPLANLAPPCAVRAQAIRALDKARVKWAEIFIGGGVTAVTAAAAAGLAVTPLAKRIAPPGLIDIGATFALPVISPSRTVLHSQVSDPERLAALRVLAAAFRQARSARR